MTWNWLRRLFGKPLVCVRQHPVRRSTGEKVGPCNGWPRKDCPVHWTYKKP